MIARISARKIFQLKWQNFEIRMTNFEGWSVNFESNYKKLKMSEILQFFFAILFFSSLEKRKSLVEKKISANKLNQMEKK